MKMRFEATELLSKSTVPGQAGLAQIVVPSTTNAMGEWHLDSADGKMALGRRSCYGAWENDNHGSQTKRFLIGFC
jgi:hypothetical protein